MRSDAVDERSIRPGSPPHDISDKIPQIGFPGSHLFPIQVHLGLADSPLQEGIGLAHITGHNVLDLAICRTGGGANLLERPIEPRDLAVFYPQVQNPQGLGVFPGLDDNGLAHLLRLEQFRMGVAADDDIDPRDPRSQFFVRLKAAMRQDDDDIGPALKFREILLNRALRGAEGQAHHIPGMGGDGGFRGNHADDGDSDPLEIFDDIGLEGRETFNVGSQHGEAGLGYPFF